MECNEVPSIMTHEDDVVFVGIFFTQILLFNLSFSRALCPLLLRMNDDSGGTTKRI